MGGMRSNHYATSLMIVKYSLSIKGFIQIEYFTNNTTKAYCTEDYVLLNLLFLT